MLNVILSVIADPQQLIGLIILFLIVFWILSLIRIVTSIILKILIALLVVSIVSYLIGTGFFETIGLNHWVQIFYDGAVEVVKTVTDFLGFTE